MISDRSATCSAESHAIPPAAVRSCGTPLRELRKRVCPPLMRFAAMGLPMMPRPMKPMLFMSFLRWVERRFCHREHREHRERRQSWQVHGAPRELRVLCVRRGALLRGGPQSSATLPERRGKASSSPGRRRSSSPVCIRSRSTPCSRCGRCARTETDS